MVTDVVRLLLLVTRILDELGIPYAVGGSLASSQHGELRATNDIDVLLELHPEGVTAFVAALKPHFDIWEDTVKAAVEQGRSFGVLHLQWHVKVDFFPAGEAVLDRATLARRLPVRLPSDPGRDVYYASAEDIVLRKLAWYRAADGALDQQLRDVLGVLKLQRERLDLPYLRTTASELGLADLLERCLRDAGLA